jgi:hypothetical protein
VPFRKGVNQSRNGISRPELAQGIGTYDAAFCTGRTVLNHAECVSRGVDADVAHLLERLGRCIGLPSRFPTPACIAGTVPPCAPQRRIIVLHALGHPTWTMLAQEPVRSRREASPAHVRRRVFPQRSRLGNIGGAGHP